MILQGFIGSSLNTTHLDFKAQVVGEPISSQLRFVTRNRSKDGLSILAWLLRSNMGGPDAVITCCRFEWTTRLRKRPCRVCIVTTAPTNPRWWYASCSMTRQIDVCMYVCMYTIICISHIYLYISHIYIIYHKRQPNHPTICCSFMGSLPGSVRTSMTIQNLSERRCCHPKLHEAMRATTVLLPTRMSDFLEGQVSSWFTLGQRKSWICWWILLFCAILGSSLLYCFRLGLAKTKKHPCEWCIAYLLFQEKGGGDTSQ